MTGAKLQVSQGMVSLKKKKANQVAFFSEKPRLRATGVRES